MKIVLNNINNKYQETISIENLGTFHETFKKFSSIKVPLEAKIFVINDLISAEILLKLKKNFEKINIRSLCIYTNNRDTLLAGKFLKIDSNFVKEKQIKDELLLLNSIMEDDIFHKGTLRSGDRISAKGNLCIVGDVNPGAIVSAKKNIYVWGKLLGIACAGKNGNNNASITSLYLNPLQLRIADLIAIGPKDKPKNYYPEIAVIENKKIIIKPYIIETKN